MSVLAVLALPVLLAGAGLWRRERQLGGQAVLQRGQAKLLQPLPLGLGERLVGYVGHVGQGRATPQPQRLPERLGSRARRRFET